MRESGAQLGIDSALQQGWPLDRYGIELTDTSVRRLEGEGESRYSPHDSGGHQFYNPEPSSDLIRLRHNDVLLTATVKNCLNR